MVVKPRDDVAGDVDFSADPDWSSSCCPRFDQIGFESILIESLKLRCSRRVPESCPLLRCFGNFRKRDKMARIMDL